MAAVGLGEAGADACGDAGFFEFELELGYFLFEGGDAGCVDTVLVHVLVGADTEAEWAEEEGRSLECADAGES